MARPASLTFLIHALDEEECTREDGVEGIHEGQQKGPIAWPGYGGLPTDAIRVWLLDTHTHTQTDISARIAGCMQTHLCTDRHRHTHCHRHSVQTTPWLCRAIVPNKGTLLCMLAVNSCTASIQAWQLHSSTVLQVAVAESTRLTCQQ